MDSLINSLLSSIETQQVLLRIHEANKKDYIENLKQHGLETKKAVNSWIHEREIILTELDKATQCYKEHHASLDTDGPFSDRQN